MPQYNILPLNPSPADMLPPLAPRWAQNMAAGGIEPDLFGGAPLQPEPAKPQPQPGVAGKPLGDIQVRRQNPSLSSRPGSTSKSTSASRSYDYKGFDDHVSKQDDLVNARDSKKAALYKGDPMSAMLASNRVRELVGLLRRDAPGTSEDDPHQFKTPLVRLSSQSDSASTSGGGGSKEYSLGSRDISIPSTGGRRADGQQVPAGNPPIAPPAPAMPAVPAVNANIGVPAAQPQEAEDDAAPVPGGDAPTPHILGQNASSRFSGRLRRNLGLDNGLYT